MEEWLNYLGYVAGAFTTGSTIPQLIKTLRTKEAADVSLKMYALYLSGTCLWIIYGIIKEDWAIIITNAASGLLSVIMVVLKYKYDQKNQQKAVAKPI